MDSHILFTLIVSAVILTAIYLSHTTIEQHIKELGAQQAKLSCTLAPQEGPSLDGDVAFFKLADILTESQRPTEARASMPTIIEEEAEAAEVADQAEQIGVRKRKRTGNENKTSA